MREALLEDAAIRDLLSDRAQAAAMVSVEIALARVQAELGVIPEDHATRIAAALTDFAPDLERLRAGTAQAGVPVPALVEQLRAAVGEPAASSLHHGATSQDIVDTALVLQLRRAIDLLQDRIVALAAHLRGLIEAHGDTAMAARTRSQQAVPTTFALKAAGWALPLVRDWDRLQALRPRLLVVQLGGAAGNLAALGDRGVAVMVGLARDLGLEIPPLPWHSQRDGIAELGGWLALATGSLGKLGQDVLLLAQSEVREVRQADGGGSSTMPQKANPVRAEVLVTLARRNASLVAGLFQALVHGHERDGAAWQLEWAVLPDMVSTAAAALDHATGLAATLVVDGERMQRTIEAANGLLYAEAASFALAKHLPRADAQAAVKAACAQVQATGRDLFDVLAGDTAVPLDAAAIRASALQPAAAGELAQRALRELDRLQPAS